MKLITIYHRAKKLSFHNAANNNSVIISTVGILIVAPPGLEPGFKV